MENKLLEIAMMIKWSTIFAVGFPCALGIIVEVIDWIRGGRKEVSGDI